MEKLGTRIDHSFAYMEAAFWGRSIPCRQLCRLVLLSVGPLKAPFTVVIGLEFCSFLGRERQRHERFRLISSCPLQYDVHRGSRRS